MFTAYLDCDKDPGETDGDAGDANNIAEVEINYSKENTEKDGERSKKPSQKIGRCLKNVCKQEFWAESTIRAIMSWIQINEICFRFSSMFKLKLNPITHEVSDQRLLTISYFQLILTSFCTHGTIIDQFIVKGVHR